MEVAHPGISGTYPRLYLVYHRMKSLEVESIVALNLGNVISLGYWEHKENIIITSQTGLGKRYLA